MGWMQGEQRPLTGEQGRVFLLTSPLIGSGPVSCTETGLPSGLIADAVKVSECSAVLCGR